MEIQATEHRKVIKQHKKPCNGCPFARATTPNELGGSHPLQYVGQMRAGMWLPCHSHYVEGKSAKEQRAAEIPQCAGAAIFRTNASVDPMLAEIHKEFASGLLKLPEDTSLVFGGYDEFVSHHLEKPLSIPQHFIDALAVDEIMQADVQVVPKEVVDLGR